MIFRNFRYEVTDEFDVLKFKKKFIIINMSTKIFFSIYRYLT